MPATTTRHHRTKRKSHSYTPFAFSSPTHHHLLLLFFFLLLLLLTTASFLASFFPSLRQPNHRSPNLLNQSDMSAAAGVPQKLNETFYISHGSPTLSIDETIPARHFLQSWRQKVFHPKPKAILVISGHWDTAELAVNAVDGPLDTIYDFYGFPKPMYQIKYPAPGSPELANRVKDLLMESGFKRVNVDKKRGLDHGAWVPLMLMYPDADIPVCQLSVQSNKDATHHYNVGKALAPLKEEGILIFGSGSATHNLRKLNPHVTTQPTWAADFDNWLEDALVSGRYEDVNHYEEKAPYAREAHPWPDHFYPLHVAIGAAGGNPKAELIHRSWGLSSMSYASYKFTTPSS